MAYKRLGDLLVGVGVLTEEQLQDALQKQKESGLRLGAHLIASGVITEKQLIETLQMQLGVEFVDLSKISINPELANLVPKNIAKKNSVVPVKLVRDELFLAMADPLNFYAIEDVKKSSHKRVTPMIAQQEQVDKAVMRLYGNEGATRAIEEMRKEQAADPQQEAFAAIGQQTTKIDEEVNAAPTIRLVNSIIERAVSEAASDIHLEPRELMMVVRIRVDGVLREVLTVPNDVQEAVIARLKVMSGMNTSERRIPQDGRANVTVKSKDIDLRVSTLPTIYGEKMVIRLLDKSAQFLSRNGIGLDEVNSKRYDKIMRNTNGVILISGPTGSGKSSTMSTMIHELNSEEVNLVTLEDPVEFNIDGVNQVQINEKTGMTFAGGLRSILRQDPDIISVGEIRDGETAEIAMRAAITGHLVLSTIHTGDAISTLDRLSDIGVEPYLSSVALKGVIAQRLVRKICPNCKETYEPTDDQLDVVGIERKPGLVFYRGAGCPNCSHTGYKGRTGVFEILDITKDIRKGIMTGALRHEYEACARADGFVSIAERCRQLLLDGTTSYEEAAKTIYSTNE